MLVFWRFGTIICIVAFFITVKVSGPNLLFCGLGIDANGWGLFLSVANTFQPMPSKPFFGPLDLNFLEREESLEPWVYTFEKVL